MPGSYRATLIPGDGTGPEIVAVACKCIAATGVRIEWDTHQAGAEVAETLGTPLPDDVVESIRRNGLALKGPVTTPVGKGFRSVNVALRHALDLYACVRPCKSYPGVRSLYRDIDLVIVRENSEDLYAGIEFAEGSDAAREIIAACERLQPKKIRHDSGISIKPISVAGSRRIVQFAFDYARRYRRRKVTAVHKANIMKHSDGLFLEVARQVAEENGVKVHRTANGIVTYEGGDIEFDDRIVDNMCMQLVQKPELYDVLVLPNLYGDIVSDLCAGLVGGLGVAPGANIGEKGAVFEATHGSAPKYKGQNKVNPTAVILSGVLLLRHIGETDAADRLERAVAAVIAEGKSVTYDLKADRDDPTAVGTREMGEAIIRAVSGVRG
ncbi:MAG TPA: isocitrate/isopropylmalate dehydrogenase family protein [Planctomycetota bacterium]|nr:isocitrate/isopropylmalate dehydrogenase family protein [Planctomycetota bacterium]HRT97225.1 isocitrate/isopropylmalate dehydrogenase family protein [Planctomycetota bacterium]